MFRLMIAAVAMLATAIPASAQVTIQGTGSVSATPDTAYITLSVDTTANTANTALDENVTNMQKLMKKLADLGIPKKDIATGSFNVGPRYSNKPNEKTGEPALVGYNVTNEVSVTVCQMDQMGKVLDQAVKHGATRVGSLHFGFSNQNQLLDDARKRAVEDAKRKANLYATAADTKLGAIASITEEGGYRPRTYYSAARAEGAGGDVPVNPGQQTLTINVTITWKFADTPVKPTEAPLFTPRK